jgi:hypothetical protein
MPSFHHIDMQRDMDCQLFVDRSLGAGKVRQQVIEGLSMTTQEQIRKLEAERDRAVAAFHAAIRRPLGVVPLAYRDLYDSCHHERSGRPVGATPEATLAVAPTSRKA